MAAISSSPVYSTQFDPQTGQPVEIAPGLVRVTAPNASPYTFTGTNSFVLGIEEVFLIDPGPDDPDHLQALQTALKARKLKAILLTHTHRDHSALAPRLRQLTGAPLWFGGPHRPSRPRRLFEIDPFAAAGHYGLIPDRVIGEGSRLEVDGIDLAVVPTPGHCANHLAFALEGTPFLLTGDHVMGWNSTLIGAPDGSLGAYLDSLDRVIAMSQTTYLPAHGGPIADGPDHARALKAHRLARNDQILQAIAVGKRDLNRLTRYIYPDLGGSMLIAARQTIIAHLDYLGEKGKVTNFRTPFGTFIRRL